MKRLSRVVALCVTLLLSGVLGFGPAPLSARNPTGQPDGGPGILAETVFAAVPVYSVMKTETTALGLGAVLPKNAFAPIALPCPASAGANGCTFRVSVVSQFSDLPPNAANMNLIITGPGTLGPAALINVAAVTDTFWAQTHSMQWVKRNIPAGSSPTVTVQFGMTFGTGTAAYRTLSIDVFTGLL